MGGEGWGFSHMMGREGWGDGWRGVGFQVADGWGFKWLMGGEVGWRGVGLQMGNGWRGWGFKYVENCTLAQTTLTYMTLYACTHADIPSHPQVLW